MVIFVSDETSNAVQQNKERIKRRAFSRVSKGIAFAILERLDQLGWSQKRLADELYVKPQQVSKWVKGKENFTIETLVNISKALDFDLIKINDVPRLEAVSEPI